jgi:thiamine-monophosphate kinase
VRAGEDPDPPGASGTTLAELGERGLIRRLRRRLPPPGPEVLVGLGDDAAAVSWGGETLLLTTDTLLEGIHFRRSTTNLRDLGAKAIAVNVSDIAAMGGEPRYALLALALPPSLAVAEVDELYAGVHDMARQHGVTLVGGDTCAAPGGVVLSVTLVGRVTGTPLRRAGARAGDALLVTGTLGAAAAGLAVLERGQSALPLPPAVVEAVVRPHRVPTPRVAESRLIRASGWATAMIDLSDGLVTDLGHIAAEGGGGARVDVDALPVSESTRAVARALGVDPLSWALSGGEDYELLFATAPERATEIARTVTERTGTPVHRIGEVRPADDGVRFLDRGGHPHAVQPGFDHFG